MATRARANKPHPIRDVTLLMMVRYMPDEDFLALCHDVMDTGLAAQGFTPDAFTRVATGSHGEPPCDTPCRICGGEVKPEPLERKAKALAGMDVCKACIDQTVAALFGPDPRTEARAALVFERIAEGG
jgi:hypothetical protein